MSLGVQSAQAAEWAEVQSAQAAEWAEAQSAQAAEWAEAQSAARSAMPWPEQVQAVE
jgi:hypothetical protein